MPRARRKVYKLSASEMNMGDKYQENTLYFKMAPTAASSVTIEAVDGSAYKDIRSGSIPLTGEYIRYPAYAPTWEGHGQYSAWEDFEHVDAGSRADKSLKNLFPDGESKYSSALTPRFGSNVNGVQLSQLSDKGKDELALYVAQRGVVVFRDQDLRDKPIKETLEFSDYFGRAHIHPTSGAPKGYPEIHLVYRQKGGDEQEQFYKSHTSSVAWHSDVTYEKQPPGTTFLAILDGPPSGGDTVFSDTEEAYNRLSPEFQKRLHGLRALHSAVAQASAATNRGGVVRRDPVETWHPIVRTHPVTGKKALFVNPQFTRRIEGLKVEESDYLLNFLYDHIARSIDLHVRAKWEDGTVVVWDNRRAVHSALLDFDSDHTRHAFRLTPQAERPFETEWTR